MKSSKYMTYVSEVDEINVLSSTQVHIEIKFATRIQATLGMNNNNR